MQTRQPHTRTRQVLLALRVAGVDGGFVQDGARRNTALVVLELIQPFQPLIGEQAVNLQRDAATDCRRSTASPPRSTGSFGRQE